MMIMEFQFMQNINTKENISEILKGFQNDTAKDMKFLELRDGIILN
jgi:hypothetical protein